MVRMALVFQAGALFNSMSVYDNLALYPREHRMANEAGIKEKVMAAQRANIKTVLLPEGNRKDLTEVPQEVKEGLKFVFAERVEDVWKEALIPLYLVKARDRKYDEAEYKADKQKSERSETQR